MMVRVREQRLPCWKVMLSSRSCELLQTGQAEGRGVGNSETISDGIGGDPHNKGKQCGEEERAVHAQACVY
jgi:hypothetical protein